MRYEDGEFSEQRRIPSARKPPGDPVVTEGRVARDETRIGSHADTG